jgi:hypothetical protein
MILQVLNDFVAVGYAIPTLEEDDVVVINKGERIVGGPVAVLGPGTGLGEVQLMWDSGALPIDSMHAEHDSHNRSTDRGLFATTQRSLVHTCTAGEQWHRRSCQRSADGSSRSEVRGRRVAICSSVCRAGGLCGVGVRGRARRLRAARSAAARAA